MVGAQRGKQGLPGWEGTWASSGRVTGSKSLGWQKPFNHDAESAQAAKVEGPGAQVAYLIAYFCTVPKGGGARWRCRCASVGGLL